MKLLVSSIILVMSKDRQMMALTLYLIVLDQLGRLFTNFDQYSQTKIYLLQTVEKYLKTVSEVFFCIELNLAPVYRTLVTKDVTMQWFVG